MSHLTIPLPPVFNYQSCLKFLARSSNECLFTINNGTIRQMVSNKEGFSLIRISKEENYLKVVYEGMKSQTDSGSFIKSYVEDWLDLKTDLSQFYALTGKDPVIGPLVKKYRGLRLIGIPGLFEAIAWSVIGQQINLTFAYSLKRQFVERHGHSQSIDGHRYFSFPEPGKIALLSVDDLKAIQFSRQKAEYLIGIANILEKGELNKESLSRLNFEEAKKELIKIRGIGNWSANYVLMKCIRHPQAFPIEDVGLHNAIKKQLGLDKKPDLDTINKLAEPWGEWKAYATFYLWHSLLEN